MALAYFLSTLLQKRVRVCKIIHELRNNFNYGPIIITKSDSNTSLNYKIDQNIAMKIFPRFHTPISKICIQEDQFCRAEIVTNLMINHFTIIFSHLVIRRQTLKISKLVVVQDSESVVGSVAVHVTSLLKRTAAAATRSHTSQHTEKEKGP